MNSTSPGTGRLLMFSSASLAACSAASEVEMQSSVSPHLSIIAFRTTLQLSTNTTASG
uniref:Dmt101 n=1 Tax=Arundo donax TaxID=35708 RepID=A0A0A9RU07_ARUDO